MTPACQRLRDLPCIDATSTSAATKNIIEAGPALILAIVVLLYLTDRPVDAR